MSPLYAVVDADLASDRGFAVHTLADAFFDAGVRLLQLRAKGAPSGRLLDWSDAIAASARRAGATFVVNDRADIAKMCDASGVHVGQDDLSARSARALVGDDAVVGVSTHTTMQVDAALGEPLSYLAVGPVFATGTKHTGYAPVGLDLIRYAVERAGGLPVVGIGGITLERAPAVLAAGAAAVVVISDLLASADPGARARAYLDALKWRDASRQGR